MSMIEPVSAFRRLMAELMNNLRNLLLFIRSGVPQDGRYRDV